MSTPNLIGKQNTDGSISYIYCHHDGCPEHNGKILKEHYTNPKIIDQLLKLGDMSCLGSKPIPAKSFDDFAEETCIPYSIRDEWTPAGHANNEAEYLDAFGESACDFCYLFKDGQWFYIYAYDQKEDGWKPVSEEV